MLFSSPLIRRDASSSSSSSFSSFSSSSPSLINCREGETQLKEAEPDQTRDAFTTSSEAQTLGNASPTVGYEQELQLNQMNLTSSNVEGILSIEFRELKPNRTTYVAASYVKFLEAAGARVVPVRLNLPLEEYQRLFKSINGYQRVAWIFYELALEANERGDYFPLWGTCLGFELLLYMASERTKLSPTNASGVTLPMSFTKEAKGSRMFRGFPTRLLKDMASESVTQHSHKWGLKVSNHKNNKALKKFFKVLSTNTDGRITFVSTVEAYHFPFYGTQWHPEKNAFEWRSRPIPHSPSKKEEQKALIYNYKPVRGTAESPFEQLYIFRL
ncbi:Gamma-glutamyl hydrolase [Liparis tanakae]|uniref:folate gamma-glutamyl hydrolase n=1 Tax=Liparis tanakae TaxID=230148 RepID=A0A4Z2II79_9TELE|nr:Gamma-glutamyl hydrolase [Liparis tanakae]